MNSDKRIGAARRACDPDNAGHRKITSSCTVNTPTLAFGTVASAVIRNASVNATCAVSVNRTMDGQGFVHE